MNDKDAARLIRMIEEISRSVALLHRIMAEIIPRVLSEKECEKILADIEENLKLAQQRFVQ